MQLAAEVKNDGSVSEFVFATSVNSADYMKQGTNHYRLIHDHLGSPRLVVNSLDGTIVQRLDYNEWGNVIADSNPNFQPFGFAGGLYDADTKLIKFGARDYNPSVARWNSKDPILFAGGDANLYRYVIGDPINYFDPEGELAFSTIVVSIIIAETVRYLLDEGRLTEDPAARNPELKKREDRTIPSPNLLPDSSYDINRFLRELEKEEKKLPRSCRLV